jgi:hypothetical protein
MLVCTHQALWVYRKQCCATQHLGPQPAVDRSPLALSSSSSCYPLSHSINAIGPAPLRSGRRRCPVQAVPSATLLLLLGCWCSVLGLSYLLSKEARPQEDIHLFNLIYCLLMRTSITCHKHHFNNRVCAVAASIYACTHVDNLSDTYSVC